MSHADVYVHATADVSDRAAIGDGSKIWNLAQIRERVEIGEDVIVSKNVYIDADVHIGSRCKIQNNVSVYHGVRIEDGVFVGPHVCFTNDKVPRAINADGTAKSTEDWEVSETRVMQGASIGAHSVILPGLVIGAFAMVGAGSVVTKSVPPHGLVLGNPARIVGYVCYCGRRLLELPDGFYCEACRQNIPAEAFDGTLDVLSRFERNMHAVGQSVRAGAAT